MSSLLCKSIYYDTKPLGATIGIKEVDTSSSIDPHNTADITSSELLITNSNTLSSFILQYAQSNPAASLMPFQWPHYTFSNVVHDLIAFQISTIVLSLEKQKLRSTFSSAFHPSNEKSSIHSCIFN